MKAIKILTESVLLVLVVASPGVSQRSQVSNDPDLPNLYQVNESLYRGGQPRKGGLEKLKGRGVKTIINLRNDDSLAKAYGKEVESLGLRYFNVPFDNFGRPSDASVERVLSLINSPENQPVFVNCKRGSDRTGTIIAIYRILHDGWSSERAKEEAREFGMGFWQLGMRGYIDDYSRRTRH